jgi:hypothetical protein
MHSGVTQYGATCYDPGAVLTKVLPQTAHAVRCYSPALAYGFCWSGDTFTFPLAVQACDSLVYHGVSDWRLPYTVVEAGAMCGRCVRPWLDYIIR